MGISRLRAARRMFEAETLMLHIRAVVAPESFPEARAAAAAMTLIGMRGFYRLLCRGESIEEAARQLEGVPDVAFDALGRAYCPVDLIVDGPRVIY